MNLKRTVLNLAGAGAVCAGIAAGAPIAAVAAAAVAFGTLTGFSVSDAREGRRKHFDQDSLREADKTALAYREQKRQAITEPTVGVITAIPFWRKADDPPVPLEQVPASRFCKVHRIYKDVTNADIAAWPTLDVLYHSGTECLGRGYYCLKDGPQDLTGTDVYGHALAPTTARFPKRWGTYEPYPHMQSFHPDSLNSTNAFAPECQRVVEYCGSIK